MSNEADESRPRRLRTVIRFVIGFALLVGAIWFIFDQHSAAVAGAFEHARAAHWMLLTLGLLLPIANWSAVSWSFQVLSLRFGRVGVAEMHGLIASAWLLNYLPMRPGLAGRLAYHKLVNGIRVRDAVAVSFLGLGLSVLSTGVLVLAAFAAPGRAGDAWSVGVLVLPAALCAAGAVLFAAWSEVLLACALRYADMLCWAARYAVVFAIVGMPIGVELAAGLAAVSQIAFLLPIAGNGLGVREWSVGLLAGYTQASTPDAVAIAIAADLVNRGFELAVATPLGAIATPIMAERARRWRRHTPEAGDPASDTR